MILANLIFLNSNPNPNHKTNPNPKPNPNPNPKPNPNPNLIFYPKYTDTLPIFDLYDKTVGIRLLTF